MSKLNTPLTKENYSGLKSTLCTGCGHDSVTSAIQQAYLKSQIHPHHVAKISGIGCSSKTTAYFMQESHGFNTIHGRMAAVATGAKIANHQLHIIGVSGDGDTASIGISGFLHTIRKNIPMVYIIENNGVYGLTKGQFSATADLGVPLKTGGANPWDGLDLCAMAIEAGATFVARSFSGDNKQLTTLLQLAAEHNGTAVIDVISPCIAYANHEGSTKSYDYIKSHKVTLQQLGYISESEPISAEFKDGDVEKIILPSGAQLIIRKLKEQSHDLTDPLSGLQLLHQSRKKSEVLTGLIHYRGHEKSLIEKTNLCERPLTQLTESDLRPTPEMLSKALLPYK